MSDDGRTEIRLADVADAAAVAGVHHERHGFTVLDTNDGSRNMENLPDMTLHWAPGGAPCPR